MSTLDLGPATRATAAVVAGVADDQLAGATPCPDWSVADLLDHVGGLSLAFTAAARKDTLEEHAPSADGSRLEPGWRVRITGALDKLAVSWREPGAFDGVTMAGPVELPGEVAALVALNEVVVHGWDLAAATGQSYDVDTGAVAAARAFVESFEPPEVDAPDAPADGGSDGDGLFGPPVAVPPDAPDLHHLLGGAGRDPHWTP